LDGCSENFKPPVVENNDVEIAYDNENPTEETQEQIFDMDWKGFVMVESGGCTYETKARNIENAGA